MTLDELKTSLKQFTVYDISITQKNKTKKKNNKKKQKKKHRGNDFQYSAYRISVTH